MWVIGTPIDGEDTVADGCTDGAGIGTDGNGGGGAENTSEMTGPETKSAGMPP